MKFEKQLLFLSKNTFAKLCKIGADCRKADMKAFSETNEVFTCD